MMASRKPLNALDLDLSLTGSQMSVRSLGSSRPSHVPSKRHSPSSTDAEVSNKLARFLISNFSITMPYDDNK